MDWWGGGGLYSLNLTTIPISLPLVRFPDEHAKRVTNLFWGNGFPLYDAQKLVFDFFQGNYAPKIVQNKLFGGSREDHGKSCASLCLLS